MLINIDAENSIFCQKKKKNLKNILFIYVFVKISNLENNWLERELHVG